MLRVAGIFLLCYSYITVVPYYYCLGAIVQIKKSPRKRRGKEESDSNTKRYIRTWKKRDVRLCLKERRAQGQQRGSRVGIWM
jgi:hypothetical protein